MSMTPRGKAEASVDGSATEQQSLSDLDNEHSEAYKEMARRITMKFDVRIIPIVCLFWLASFIDRSNVGNAKIAGLSTDLHLKGNEFNSALCVFYVSYIVSELPSNWIIKRVQPRRWLPLSVVCWGIVTTMTCFVKTFGGLLAVRFFLGLFEGGVLPGLCLYMTSIYSPFEFQSRVAVFYASASMAGAFGGLLASATFKMDGLGNLAGWRWMFVLEGIASVLVGILAYYVLPPDIEHASFLTEEERDFAMRRHRKTTVIESLTPASLASRNQAENFDGEKSATHQLEDASVGINCLESSYSYNEKFEWYEVTRGVLEPQVWLTGIGYFGLLVALYSYSVFLPSIVAGLGYKGESAQLHTVPPYVPATVLTLIVAVLSDRMKLRGPFILACVPLAIAGYALAICAKTVNQRYGAIFLIGMGVYPSGPCMVALMSNNMSGHYKKATAIALQLMIANSGSFVAMFAYTADQAPSYIRGHSITLGFVILTWVMIALNILYTKWENKARAEGRRDSNIQKYIELWDSGKTRAPIGDRNPEFRFTL